MTLLGFVLWTAVLFSFFILIVGTSGHAAPARPPMEQVLARAVTLARPPLVLFTRSGRELVATVSCGDGFRILDTLALDGAVDPVMLDFLIPTWSLRACNPDEARSLLPLDEPGFERLSGPLNRTGAPDARRRIAELESANALNQIQCQALLLRIAERRSQIEDLRSQTPT